VFFSSLSQAICSAKDNPVSLFQLFRGLALAVPAEGLSDALRNPRSRFRRSSFFFRSRLNLALSPFLFDIKFTLVRFSAR
jgi:hypothetical protein